MSTKENMSKKLENILVSQKVEFVWLAKKELSFYQQEWRKVYAQRLFARMGTWTFRGYDWHVFSYRFTPCFSGDVAWNEYRRVFSSPFLLLPNLNDGKGYACKSDKPLNLSMKGFDCYLCTDAMDWTYVHTHEENWCGPYFSNREMARA